MSKIKVAIVGVGNVTSALVQGIDYYSEDDSRPGLWHKLVGGYSVKDIEIVNAFDIDNKKVNLDLSDAIFEKPNVMSKVVDLEKSGIVVKKGMLSDKLPNKTERFMEKVDGKIEDIIDTLKNNKIDIVLNVISSGLEQSSLSYSNAALLSNCCFINCTPSIIACDDNLRNEFSNSGLVLVGDDLMSQFGGTVLHKGLLDFMDQRGIKTVKSYQLDVGGGMDTLSTIEEKVKLEKRKIKSNSISLELPYEFKTAAGTTDFVEFMNNNRTSYYWIQGLNYLGSNIYLDVYLRTIDGTNSGNILLDTIRASKKAKENGDFGTPLDICGYGFKKIPKPMKFRRVFDIFEKNYLKFS